MELPEDQSCHPTANFSGAAAQDYILAPINYSWSTYSSREIPATRPWHHRYCNIVLDASLDLAPDGHLGSPSHQMVTDRLGFFEEANRTVPHLATAEHYFLFNICYDANHQSGRSSLDEWVLGITGYAFSVDLGRKLIGQLSPDEFILTLFALLSYYRILNRRKAFEPTYNSNGYLAGLEKLGQGGTIDDTGGLLECVVHSVIKIGGSLRPALLDVSYLQPYQLDREQTAETLSLDVYCSARLSKPSEHLQTVVEVNGLLGIRHCV